MKPLVSVIVPGYNSEKYAQKILECIRNQTLDNIEIILVNDGSTDGTLSIFYKNSSIDSRIRVVSQTNKGVSSARNTGINIANGKYIYFVDCDDYLESNALELLVNYMNDNDLLIGGHEIIKNNKIIYSWKKVKFIESYNRFDALKLMFDPATIGDAHNCHGYLGYSVNKLYKLDIINKYNIRFDETISYNEDRLFVISYLLHCDKISILNVVLYKYLLNEAGAMEVSKKRQGRDRSCIVKMLSEIKAFNIMLSLLKFDNDLYAMCLYESIKKEFRLLILIYGKDRIIEKRLLCDIKKRIYALKKSKKINVIHNIIIHILLFVTNFVIFILY